MQKLGSVLPQKFKQALGSNINMSREEYEKSKVDSYNETAGNLHSADGYDCPACKNKGMVAKLEYSPLYGYGVEVLAKCKCMKARNALARLNRSGLGNVVKKHTFDSYQTPNEWQQKIKETALLFCKGEHNCFFIGGQSGCGKTKICTAIAVHFIRQGMETRYMVWPEEIQGIQASISSDPEKYQEKMAELKNTDVLYIDDLFKYGRDKYTGKMGFPSEPEQRRAFEILNSRFNQPDKITIISTERTMADLEDIDTALAGRITEYTKDHGFCLNVGLDDQKNWRRHGIIEL